MKKAWIKMCVPMAGNHGLTWDAGQIVQWDAEDAARLIERGYAEPAEAPAKK